MRLYDLFESVGLVQHVKEPTHVGGHILDLIVTRQTDQIIDNTPKVDDLFSDHSSVLCQIQVGKSYWKKSHVSYRKTKSID